MKLVTDGKFTCEEINEGKELQFKINPEYYARLAIMETIKR